MACDQTMMGFVQKKGSKNAQCFYGRLDESESQIPMAVFNTCSEDIGPKAMVQLATAGEEFMSADEEQNQEQAMTELVAKK